jgi:hypothetical protein
VNRTLLDELSPRYPNSRFNETNRVLSGDELAPFFAATRRRSRLTVLTDTVSRGARVAGGQQYGVGLDMIDLDAAGATASACAGHRTSTAKRLPS